MSFKLYFFVYENKVLSIFITTYETDELCGM